VYRLEISDHAEEDFDEVIVYIAETLAAPRAAAEFADEVYACYDRLEQNPFVYEECRDPRLKKEGYRRAIINNYVLIYRIYEEKKLVIAHRFFYGGQDYAKLI
jgi:plasmid stabilization system protein ParE